MVNCHAVSSVVDGGASLLLLNEWHGYTFKVNTPIMGVLGTPTYPLQKPFLYIWIPFVIPFLYSYAKLPSPLLGQDFLHQLKTSLSFPSKIPYCIYNPGPGLVSVPPKPPGCPLLARINPMVWDSAQS